MPKSSTQPTMLLLCWSPLALVPYFSCVFRGLHTFYFSAGATTWLAKGQSQLQFISKVRTEPSSLWAQLDRTPHHLLLPILASFSISGKSY